MEDERKSESDESESLDTLNLSFGDLEIQEPTYANLSPRKRNTNPVPSLDNPSAPDWTYSSDEDEDNSRNLMLYDNAQNVEYTDYENEHENESIPIDDVSTINITATNPNEEELNPVNADSDIEHLIKQVK